MKFLNRLQCCAILSSLGVSCTISMLTACAPIRAAEDASILPDGSTADAGVAIDADPCDTEVCECTTDDECGLHEVCDQSGPGRECVCAPRYIDEGSGCVWGGAPDDPSFQDADAWQTSGSALVNPSAEGSIAAGAAVLLPAAVCSLATISQTVEMPRYERAEGLAIETTYRFQGGMYDSVGPAIGINGFWQPLQGQEQWQTEHRCLGDAAYGGEVEFALSAANTPFDCSTTLEVDHLEVIPDAGCPVPGQIIDANFESGAGWSSQSGGSGTAAVVSGVGFEFSGGGELSTSTLCSDASLIGLASLPSKMASPALEMWWNSRSGTELSILVERWQLTQLKGTGSEAESRICVPPGMLGWGHQLKFSLPYHSGLCATSDVRRAAIDNLAVVDEPSCGSDPYIVDGGLEVAAAGNIITPWFTTVDKAERGSAQILNDAARAQTGNGVIQLSLKQRCATAKASTWITVPFADGGNGPAVRFAHNVPSNPTSIFYTSPGNGAIAEGNGWTTEVLCLDPKKAGRMEQVSFSMNASGSCANTFNSETVWIDDVEVITSAQCPLP